MAQTAPGAADGAPSEAARRAALGPYRFILSAPAAAPKPKPAPAPVEAARKPAPQPEQTAAARPAAPVREAPVAAPPEPVQQPAPAPAPVAVAAPTAQPAPAVAAVRKTLVAIKQDPPELSGALLREHPTGTVTVAFEVNPDGSTSGVKVVSSTNRKLNNVSMAAVAGWKFQPIDVVVPTEIEL
ncbi:MAG TPA: energy transducer TonB, partial [Ramlibacter sp.]|nr:energy transducer TonB [Ramlibacter sp.]